MSYKKYFLIVTTIICIDADWIRLPKISPTTKVPSVPFKLSPELDSNAFGVNSFSGTTETAVLNENVSTMKSLIRQYLQSTVTSKVVHVLNSLPSITSLENMEQIHLHTPENQNKKKIVYLNKTVQMNVIPYENHHEMSANEENSDGANQTVFYQINNDDEGNFTEDFGDVYYDDDYYYEYEETTKFSAPKSTTKTLKKTHKMKRVDQKLQKRTMMQIMNNKQYRPFSDVSFPSFIKFIKRIQESFAIRTAKTIGEKIKMLVHFRDQLMLTINKQISRLWKGQSQAKKSFQKRTKRTLGMDIGHSSGAMDFPSAEGALLSICFLTFAVFLIKLVLVRIYFIWKC